MVGMRRWLDWLSGWRRGLGAAVRVEMEGRRENWMGKGWRMLVAETLGRRARLKGRGIAAFERKYQRVMEIGMKVAAVAEMLGCLW